MSYSLKKHRDSENLIGIIPYTLYIYIYIYVCVCVCVCVYVCVYVFVYLSIFLIHHQVNKYLAMLHTSGGYINSKLLEARVWPVQSLLKGHFNAPKPQ